MRHYKSNQLRLFRLILSEQQGFTLIELLVVVIIVGILAAVATPMLIGNIGKARETEATTSLGAISRSQQAYHFEQQTFADTLVKLDSNVSVDSSYYDFPDPLVASNILVQHQAIPSDTNNKLVVKNYASGVYFDMGTGNYNTIICQGNGINQLVDAPSSAGGNCSNGGRQIK